MKPSMHSSQLPTRQRRSSSRTEGMDLTSTPAHRSEGVTKVGGPKVVDFGS